MDPPSEIAGEIQNQQPTSGDQSPDETPIPIAVEILEDTTLEILSRLPVQTLLKFRSVSKPWISLISHPSFHKLQFTHATNSHRTALLISAYDSFTRKRYLLSAAPDGGPITHLVSPKARTVTNKETTEIEHLNGLVLFSSGNGFIEHNFAFIVNPSTRKIYKLHGPACKPDTVSYGKGHICYFFGFDETRNEHKVLTIRMFGIRSMKPFVSTRIQIMIFSMSSLTWRKIDSDLPHDVVKDWNLGTKHGVCVNSVIHLILQERCEILAFDLRTERFSIINLPVGYIRDTTLRRYCKKGWNTIISNQPFLMKINGFLGVMCYNASHVETMYDVDVWILKDYENRGWVRERVCFSKSQFLLDGPFPLNSFRRKNGGFSTDLINVHMYDVESKSTKPVEFTLGYEFLRCRTVRFDHVKSYTESILPLPTNKTC